MPKRRERKIEIESDSTERLSAKPRPLFFCDAGQTWVEDNEKAEDMIKIRNRVVKPTVAVFLWWLFLQ